MIPEGLESVNEEESRISFVEQLASQFPPVKAIVDEEAGDSEPGEKLPTFNVMPSVARWVVEAVDSTPLEVAGVLGWIERAFETSDGAVQGLIAVGFAESLPRSFEPAAALVHPHRGRYLRRLVEINEHKGGIFGTDLTRLVEAIPGRERRARRLIPPLFRRRRR